MQVFSEIELKIFGGFVKVFQKNVDINFCNTLDLGMNYLTYHGMNGPHMNCPFYELSWYKLYWYVYELSWYELPLSHWNDE